MDNYQKNSQPYGGMKITASNYASECIRDLKAISSKSHPLHKQLSPKELGGISLLVSALSGLKSASKHYVLPDIGRIFYRQGAGLKGKLLRLPAPVISGEFWVSPATCWENKTPVAKRVFVATEVPLSLFHVAYPKVTALTEGSTHIIALNVLCALEGGGFVPSPIQLFIPNNWDFGATQGKEATSFRAIPHVAFPALLDLISASEDVTKEQLLISCAEDVADEGAALIDLLEALYTEGAEEVVYQEASLKSSRSNDLKIKTYALKFPATH